MCSTVLTHPTAHPAHRALQLLHHLGDSKVLGALFLQLEVFAVLWSLDALTLATIAPLPASFLL